MLELDNETLKHLKEFLEEELSVAEKFHKKNPSTGMGSIEKIKEKLKNLKKEMSSFK